MVILAIQNQETEKARKFIIEQAEVTTKWVTIMLSGLYRI
jgi:hypothetical protein